MSKACALISSVTAQHLELYRLAVRTELREELREEVRAEMKAKGSEDTLEAYAEGWNSGHKACRSGLVHTDYRTIASVVSDVRAGCMSKKEGVVALTKVIPNAPTRLISDFVGCSESYVYTVLYEQRAKQ